MVKVFDYQSNKVFGMDYEDDRNKRKGYIL